MDVSLRGLVEYAQTKKGISISPKYRHLRDLEILINNMYDIRNGSREGCNSHGNELDTDYTHSITICNGHVGTIHDPNDLSLGKFRDELIEMRECTCDSYKYTQCKCVARCECQGDCSCDSRCDCDCDHCLCDSDTGDDV